MHSSLNKMKSNPQLLGQTGIYFSHMTECSKAGDWGWELLRAAALPLSGPCLSTLLSVFMAIGGLEQLCPSSQYSRKGERAKDVAADTVSPHAQKANFPQNNP